MKNKMTAAILWIFIALAGLIFLCALAFIITSSGKIEKYRDENKNILAGSIALLVRAGKRLLNVFSKKN